MPQEKEIQNMIIDTMPDQLKLPFSLWTRKAVKELVEREFGVVLAINTMGDYLRKWVFSPQKPKKKAYEQNPKAVQKWLDEEYPAIKEKAKKVYLILNNLRVDHSKLVKAWAEENASKIKLYDLPSYGSHKKFGY